MRLLALAVVCLPLLASDPWIGKWKMDPMRSVFPGQPPSNVVLTYQELERGFRFTSSGVLQDGTPYEYGYVCAVGRSGCKVENHASFDSVALDWKDHVLEIRFSGQGKVLVTHLSRFTDDGKVMTTESVWVRPDGTTFETKGHFDRQTE